MRSIMYALVICTVLFSACNNSASNKNETDSLSQAPVLTDSLALALTGVYQGYLPCADCPGISTFLLLNEDMTYRLEETYNKGNDSLFLTRGKWKTENGKVILLDSEQIRNSYLPDGNNLVQLDYQGDRISGNLGDKYVLSRQPRADNKHLKDKIDAGIDFFANGNEPFWSLDLDKGKFLVVNRPGLDQPDTLVYVAPVNNNGVREYISGDGKSSLRVRISPQFCSDGMSDFVYEYKVELEYKKQKYSGCGRLLGEF